jgi:DeoR/GlpR family transcriptional regulator of sugar metabolism
MESPSLLDTALDSTAKQESAAAQSNDRVNLKSWVVRSGDTAKLWKNALAKYVISHRLIKYGDSLLIGSGTTFIYLMKEIVETQIVKREAPDLAIVTSNLQVLYAVRDAQGKRADLFGNTQVILTGGRLNNSLDSLIGDYAALAARSELFNPRIVFFGAAGLSFRNGLNISFQFEEEISTQVAFATRPTVDRILLVDHYKLGKPSFYNARLSLHALMQGAQNCYVITTFDPDRGEVVSMLKEEQKALTQLLKPLANAEDMNGKDFIFRTIRVDGSVEHEICLHDFRRASNNTRNKPIAVKAAS